MTNVGSAPYTGSLTVTDQTTPAWATLLAGGYGLYFLDPDGITLELFQPPPRAKGSEG